ncbi:unnamed protein product, partial [Adineta steineri]
ISSCLCQNLTYVLTYTSTSVINSYLNPNISILTNAAVVERLLSTSNGLVSSTKILLTATNIQSIVFAWNTGDCSYPSALATSYPTIFISSPICFTQTSLSNNLLQLAPTTDQLGYAAV